jgi:butyrate kinase
MDKISRISGLKEIPNQCFIHVLNQKAISEKCAGDLNKKYQNCNFTTVHMGGGISLAAHKKGRVVDAYNGMNGLGPFSPERSGSVEPGKLIELCFSGRYKKTELLKMNVGSGGLRNHLNTNNLIEVEKRIEQGDSYALLVYKAMIFQISKFILSLAAVFGKDHIDGIILTGGLAYSKKFTRGINQMVSRISKVFIYPGGIEGEALAINAYQILTGKKKMKQYLGLSIKTPESGEIND